MRHFTYPLADLGMECVFELDPRGFFFLSIQSESSELSDSTWLSGNQPPSFTVSMYSIVPNVSSSTLTNEDDGIRVLDQNQNKVQHVLCAKSLELRNPGQKTKWIPTFSRMSPKTHAVW